MATRGAVAFVRQLLLFNSVRLVVNEAGRPSDRQLPVVSVTSVLAERVGSRPRRGRSSRGADRPLTALTG